MWQNFLPIIRTYGPELIMQLDENYMLYMYLYKGWSINYKCTLLILSSDKESYATTTINVTTSVKTYDSVYFICKIYLLTFQMMKYNINGLLDQQNVIQYASQAYKYGRRRLVTYEASERAIFDIVKWYLNSGNIHVPLWYS